MGIPYYDLNALEGSKDASLLIASPEGFLSETGIQARYLYGILGNLEIKKPYVLSM